MKKITFIGGGNMATAIIAGLKQAQPSLEIHVVEPFAEARERVAKLDAHVYVSPSREAIENADAIVLATKPQTLKDACAQLAPHVNGELIVSIAAGTTIVSISAWFEHKTLRIVRTMPNTPALIGKGITGVFAPATLAKDDVETAMQIMRSCGEVVRIDDESMIDAVTAVSASGPAYVFHWIESMIAAAKNVGFNDADARTLVLGTLEGATALAKASDESPATLRERVTSKGGTTAAALTVINERNVQQALIDAVEAARNRGRELGQDVKSM
jgi:pyrroline-5-carboxylate reductase